MARTTSAAVEAIIEVETGDSLTPFIEVANHMVTQHCTDSSYTDTTLELIERWLSAHFYAIRAPRPDSESVGPVRTKYQYKVDLNLFVTTYGQHAMLIDYEGNLAALSKRIEEGQSSEAEVTWIGSTETEAEEYDVE